jgi:hypothetical protein
VVSMIRGTMLKNNSTKPQNTPEGWQYPGWPIGRLGAGCPQGKSL